MKKIFISQPMVDKTDKEILQVRNEITEICKTIFDGEEIEILDSFFQGAPHDAKPLWFLGKAFQILSQADVAFFAKGWDQYRGCKMEHQAARQYGIQCYTWYDNIDEAGGYAEESDD